MVGPKYLLGLNDALLNHQDISSDERLSVGSVAGVLETSVRDGETTSLILAVVCLIETKCDESTTQSPRALGELDSMEDFF
jgi:hypothetical protein